MKYTLIKGSYFVVGQSPDADSIKFRADNPALWQHIDTENRAAFERNFVEGQGVVQLRFEGVDALETHYTPPNPATPEDCKNLRSATLVAPTSKGYKQLSAIGSQTTDQMLALLGISQVKWRTAGVSRYITEAASGGRLVKEKLKDAVPGYIITGDIEMNGRPIAWLYNGTTVAPDGMVVTSDELVAGVEDSLNYQLLLLGLVYPYYFMSLTGKLRSKLSSAVQQAQAAAVQAAQAGHSPGTNVWSLDSTVSGLTITDLSVISR